MPSTEQILTVLAEVAEVDEVRDNPDLRLYDLHILDSLKTVELLIALSDALGIEISPAEVDREQWATPRHILAYLQTRVGA
jgi:D-alanine--poly(phosphoribitol) ligase subunit 2